MPRNFQTRYKKVLVSLFAGFLVAIVTAIVDLALFPIGREQIVHESVGAFVAGLLTMIVCLAIQLRQEEVLYQSAIDRAAIVSELNHHVRNAIFPLCLAVQKVGDALAVQLANDAVETINIVLKDATAEALSGRVMRDAEIAPLKKPPQKAA